MSEHNLDYKTGMSEDTCDCMGVVRNACMLVESTISHCCKDSRETSIAYTKLEEALMWAIKSLAVHGHDNVVTEAASAVKPEHFRQLKVVEPAKAAEDIIPDTGAKEPA